MIIGTIWRWLGDGVLMPEDSCLYKFSTHLAYAASYSTEATVNFQTV